MSRSARREMRCGLCGHRFDAASMACHSACPLGAHCNLICCPNCGFQVVDASKTRLGGWLSRTSRSRRREDTRPAQIAVEAVDRPVRETIPLSHVLPGREVRIVVLREMSGPRISRLGAFGLVPGSLVEVVQRRPAPVVRVGETEIALSAEILERIEVAPPSRSTAPWARAPDPPDQSTTPARRRASSCAGSVGSPQVGHGGAPAVGRHSAQ